MNRSLGGSPRNDEAFSPLRNYQNLTISAAKDGKDSSSFDLVSRHPILNGYTKTVGDLGSKNTEFGAHLLNKIAGEMEVQSPQLKKSLKESRDMKSFQLKLSGFGHNKEHQEEENKSP